MKKYLITCILLTLIPVLVLAQETVYPITVEQRDDAFYQEQMKLWKKETEKDPSNAVAWQNLYHAARYYKFPAIFQDKDYRKEVKKIVDDMGKAIPNSFEYNYIYAWNSGFADDKFDYLLKAYEIDSTRPRIAEDLFTHYYKEGNWKEADRYLHKWYEQKTMPPQLMHMGYNLLACTEENSVLILSGDNDSYPTWMIQAVHQIRPDVAALNAYLMMDPEFTKKALERYNLKGDVSGLSGLDRENPNLWKDAAKFIRHLAEQNPDRRFYLPMTTIKEVQEELKDDLYVVGSVFQYCNNRFDNIAVLKKNWHQNMKLDYLDFVPYENNWKYTPAGLPYTVLIYIYPAVTLYHHYDQAGEAQNAEEMLNFAKKLSNLVGQPNLYKKYLDALNK